MHAFNHKLFSPSLRTRTRGKIVIDDFDARVIRDTIYDFYTVQKVVPSISKLLPALKEKKSIGDGVQLPCVNIC